MRTTRPIRFRITIAALGLMMAASAAWAHGLNLFATVEGATIQGTLRYADGTPAIGAPVIAYAPDGTTIAEASTDATGRFEFQARIRCRHRLVGDAGQGHRGLFTVAAEDLPESLPAPGAPTPVREATPPVEEVSVAPNLDSSTTPPDFDARVEAAVARQLRPLREQLNGYETSIRIRDVMGGIGYLFGLAGILALLKSRTSHPAD